MLTLSHSANSNTLGIITGTAGEKNETNKKKVQDQMISLRNSIKQLEN